MNRSRTLSRTVGTALVVLAGGLVLPPAPATGAPVTSSALATMAGVMYRPSVCTGPQNELAPEVAAPVDGSTTTSRASAASTITHVASGGSIRTDQQVSATTRGRLRGGQLSEVRLTATGRVATDRRASDPCTTMSVAYAVRTLDFTLERPQWVSVSLGRTGEGQGHVRISTDDGATVLETGTPPLRGTPGPAYLPAGSYNLAATVTWGVLADASDTTGSGTNAGTVTVDVGLHDPGSAVTGPTGRGSRYAVPGSAACASGTVPVTLRGAARRARSVVVSVDGRRVRTLRRPTPGRTVRVRLGSTRPTTTVRARLVVDPPGARRRATVTVTRTYRSCAPR
ncbi:hypothetical protein [Nocardioides sp. SYSU D00038]|uniref:hypothetical protein n=1 Tax=Nocardioides sp. SYSU D00038 TaxID=2812554 RepID=UPI00196793B0|nr:hypothetical protein [Nocardioides sp. SYSU D00038]